MLLHYISMCTHIRIQDKDVFNDDVRYIAIIISSGFSIV